MPSSRLNDGYSLDEFKVKVKVRTLNKLSSYYPLTASKQFDNNFSPIPTHLQFDFYYLLFLATWQAMRFLPIAMV